MSFIFGFTLQWAYSCSSGNKSKHLRWVIDWWEELTHWKRPWCWERLRARGEGGDRGWDGWVASLTQQTCCCCCWVTSVVSNSVRPHRWQPTGLLCPWDSPGKNTGVGCQSLLRCMKVKSESEVTQSCLTRSDPMVCSLPGSSVCGIFQARVLECGAIAFSTIDMSLSELRDIVIDREDWCATVQGVSNTQRWLSLWAITTTKIGNNHRVDFVLQEGVTVSLSLLWWLAMYMVYFSFEEEMRLDMYTC